MNLVDCLLVLDLSLLGALDDHFQLSEGDQFLIEHELQEIRGPLHYVAVVLGRVDTLKHSVLVDPIHD